MKRSLGIALISSALLVSCNKDPVVNPEVALANDFAQLLQDYYVSMGTTATVQVGKTGTFQEGYVVFNITSSGTTMSYAIDLTNYNSSMDIASVMTLISSGLMNNEPVTQGLTSGGTGTGVYIGSGTGNLYETTEPSAKDLETLGALIEGINAQENAKVLSAQFGLSEDRSLQVAKLVANWKHVQKSRKVTAKDADAFSKELMGVNINKVMAAYKGDSSTLNQLIDEAALHNGVSPEQMQTIMGELIAR